VSQVLRFIIYLRIRYNALSSVVALCILHLFPVTAAVPECCPPRVTGAAHRKGETEQVLGRGGSYYYYSDDGCASQIQVGPQCSAVLASLRTRRRVNDRWWQRHRLVADDLLVTIPALLPASQTSLKTLGYSPVDRYMTWGLSRTILSVQPGSPAYYHTFIASFTYVGKTRYRTYPILDLFNFSSD
jgi:hypothetical protein